MGRVAHDSRLFTVVDHHGTVAVAEFRAGGQQLAGRRIVQGEDLAPLTEPVGAFRVPRQQELAADHANRGRVRAGDLRFRRRTVCRSKSHRRW
jgi:hypothetical protein